MITINNIQPLGNGNTGIVPPWLQYRRPETQVWPLPPRKGDDQPTIMRKPIR